MDALPTSARWKAVVWYRTATGSVDVEHWLEELCDLHDIVEAGPAWDTVEKIEVVRFNHNEATDLTIEQAERL